MVEKGVIFMKLSKILAFTPHGASTKCKKKTMHLVEARRSKMRLRNQLPVETKRLLFPKVIQRLSKIDTFFDGKMVFPKECFVLFGFCHSQLFSCQNRETVVKNETPPCAPKSETKNQEPGPMHVFTDKNEGFCMISRKSLKIEVGKGPNNNNELCRNPCK